MKLLKILVILIILASITLYLQSKFQPTTYHQISDFSSKYIASKIPYYTFIKSNLVGGTLLGVIMFVAFANIPVIPNPPPEAYLIFALTKGTNPVLMILAVTGVTVITSSINYLVGYLFGPKIIEKITKKEFKYSKVMNSLSFPITLFVHFIPLPVTSFLTILFGAYKSKYTSFVTAVILGTVLRYSLVLFLFNRYENEINKIPIIGSIF